MLLAADPVNGLTIATFVVAVVAAVMSALALGWQILNYKLTGGRVKIELQLGGMHPSRRSMVSGSAAEQREGWEQGVARAGFPVLIIGVEVVNVGRLPVTIREWGLVASPGGLAYVPIGESTGPDRPFKLEAGTHQTWAVELDRARSLASASTVTSQAEVFTIRARVRLADGRTYLSHESLTIEPMTT